MALAHLDQDGWVVTGNTRTKEGQKLTLSIVTRKGTEYEQVTNLLAKTWKDTLKIDTEVRIVDQTDTAQNVFSSVLQPRNFDVLVYELELGGDPDVYTYVFILSGSQLSKHSTDTFLFEPSDDSP
jgi:ABC-type transport system substrate-binding protein